MHKEALKLAEKYLSVKGRQVYITPTRFIELFKLLDKLMLRKHK